MEETSEKRRERLKAMRMQADTSHNSEASAVPGCLSNPLIENPSILPSLGGSYASPRFDFYTDPMSAFSTNKKRNNDGNQIAAGYNTPPRYGGSPMNQSSSPIPEQMNPQMNPSPTQRFQVPYRTPVWNGPIGAGGYNYPSNPSSGVTFQSPRCDPYRSPLITSGQNISHRPCHSPGYPSVHTGSPGPGRGRGRGQWYRSPSLAWSNKQGLGSRGGSMTMDRLTDQNQFYLSSMVEDPWKSLKPVIWKQVYALPHAGNTPGSLKASMSTSCGTKRGRFSEASNTYSQPSLAEYLADALKEAVNDAEK